MSEATRIRWAQSTWNPFSGCTEVSPGCDNCYARVLAERQRGSAAYPFGFDPMRRPHKLHDPEKWRDPRRIFVNSMSDLFHRAFTQDDVDEVFEVMATVPRHQYLVLTKRPERMRHFVSGWLERSRRDRVPHQIWLGTSIELDHFVYRADVLRDIPVDIRFISAEPLLGPLHSLDLRGIAWLIVGGESGKGYRPMEHAWARELLAKARAEDVAFYFKQSAAPRTEMGQLLDGFRYEEYPDTENPPPLQEALF